LAQIFHRNANIQVRMLIVSVMTLGAFAVGATSLWYWSPWVTKQRDFIVQPVQFTHEHHVAGLGIDCRYCHFGVEQAAHATIPHTGICMNCHTQLWSDAPILEPVRESWRTNEPVRWVKVHDLASFVYFNHSAHINKGISCAECHGRVDQMALVYQHSTLHMRWCLECHVEPERFVRPKEEIYNMAYEKPDNQIALGKQLVEDFHINSKISCNACHR
jgi:hypothetical protein